MHQKKYILSKLEKRGLLTGRGSWKLPMVPEGKTPPMDKTTAEYATALKKAQEEVGTLMWLAIKTRADIAATVSVASSLQSKNPTEALDVVAGVWRYLAMTWNEVSVLGSHEKSEDLRLEIATDASLSPGGDKSRSGVVISLNSIPVHWSSSKQSLTALSSCESEISAAAVSYTHLTLPTILLV